jgi:hypothetical protein
MYCLLGSEGESGGTETEGYAPNIPRGPTLQPRCDPTDSRCRSNEEFEDNYVSPSVDPFKFTKWGGFADAAVDWIKQTAKEKAVGDIAESILKKLIGATPAKVVVDITTDSGTARGATLTDYYCPTHPTNPSCKKPAPREPPRQTNWVCDEQTGVCQSGSPSPPPVRNWVCDEQTGVCQPGGGYSPDPTPPTVPPLLPPPPPPPPTNPGTIR